MFCTNIVYLNQGLTKLYSTFVIDFSLSDKIEATMAAKQNTSPERK